MYSVIKQSGTFSSALEVGCGNGSLSCRLKNDKIVESIVGVDAYSVLDAENIFDEFITSLLKM